MAENFGIKVRVTYRPDSEHAKRGTKYEEFRNVTEIHYNYRPSQACLSMEEVLKLPVTSMNREIMIAFESDVHCTGHTMSFDEIFEFDTQPETEKAVWM